MDDGTLRGRWVGEVFTSRSISAEVQVFLLYLAQYHMEPTGRVSVPREDLARQLRCHPRKISAKFTAAISAGLLRLVARGQKHVTAVYQATVHNPQGASNRHPETSPQGAGTRPAENPQGAGFCHPETSPQGAGTRPAENPQGASNRHPDNRAPYKARARAHPKAGLVTDDETRRSISQSAQEREADRWLRAQFDGLTDFVVAYVITEARARAARARKPIRNLVPYLRGMQNPANGQDSADLADIIGAAFDAEERQRALAETPPQPELTLIDGRPPDTSPAEPTQHPMLGALPDPAEPPRQMLDSLRAELDNVRVRNRRRTAP